MEEKIKQALMQMNLDKSPDSDSFQPLFFQVLQSTVKQGVIAAVKYFLKNAFIPNIWKEIYYFDSKER